MRKTNIAPPLSFTMKIVTKLPRIAITLQNNGNVNGQVTGFTVASHRSIEKSMTNGDAINAEKASTPLGLDDICDQLTIG